MKKLIGVVVMTVAMLMLSKYGPALHAWGIQSEREQLVTSGGTERPARTETLPRRSARAHRRRSPGAWWRSSTATPSPSALAPERRPFRYIGVEASGPAAADINRRLLAGGEVRLELDLAERDQAGRLLAYVHVGTS